MAVMGHTLECNYGTTVVRNVVILFQTCSYHVMSMLESLV